MLLESLSKCAHLATDNLNQELFFGRLLLLTIKRFRALPCHVNGKIWPHNTQFWSGFLGVSSILFLLGTPCSRCFVTAWRQLFVVVLAKSFNYWDPCALAMISESIHAFVADQQRPSVILRRFGVARLYFVQSTHFQTSSAVFSLEQKLSSPIMREL